LDPGIADSEKAGWRIVAGKHGDKDDTERRPVAARRVVQGQPRHPVRCERASVSMSPSANGPRTIAKWRWSRHAWKTVPDRRPGAAYACCRGVSVLAGDGSSGDVDCETDSG